MEVIVMSRYQVENYIPGEHEVCISITSKSQYALGSDRLPKLHSNFDDILYLSFDDVDMELREVGLAEYGQSITDKDIFNVVEFVKKHIDIKNKLIIHCFAGISRSRSMAAAICEHYKLPYKYEIFNDHVYSSVLNGFVSLK